MDAPSAACSAIEAPAHAAPAPVLVIGIGNPSRGDDALGPACLAALAAGRLVGVELLDEFQLQIEHVLDLAARRAVVFVDASVALERPCALDPVIECDASPSFSHALAPAQLLGAYRRFHGQAPPRAWLLAIRGESFELGQPLTAAAQANLRDAVRQLECFLRDTSP